MSEGAELIAAERRRQVDQEGRTPEHDLTHWDEDLTRAAVCYATPYSERRLLWGNRGASVPPFWPWLEEDWKPTPGDRVRELVKAGALIAAEIDRLIAHREGVR